MLTFFQGIILGSFQGVSELFPISSLGHSVILPQILGWNVNQQDPLFLMFLVATHFATALVLLGFFWKDWVRIVKGLGRSLAAREISAGDTDARLGWLLVVATIPAGIIGLLLKDWITSHFLSATSAAIFLIANGALLYGAEILRRKSASHASDEKNSDAKIAAISWRSGIGVGLMQTLALIPGFSRTGATMAGGLMAGLSHEDAIRFSFLLSTPIILAAAVIELPQLVTSGNHTAIAVAAVGALCSALFAYLAVKFITAYFSFDTRKLTPFAIYCAAAGIGVLILMRI